MRSHKDYNDYEFLELFDQCTFPSELFTHEAHLRYAWIHLNRSGLEDAIVDISDSILKYVTHLGATDKFNLPLTVAAVKSIHHYMQLSRAATFESFIGEWPELLHDFGEVIQREMD